jgi:hypothetical protein
VGRCWKTTRQSWRPSPIQSPTAAQARRPGAQWFLRLGRRGTDALLQLLPQRWNCLSLQRIVFAVKCAEHSSGGPAKRNERSRERKRREKRNRGRGFRPECDARYSYCPGWSAGMAGRRRRSLTRFLRVPVRDEPVSRCAMHNLTRNANWTRRE